MLAAAFLVGLLALRWGQGLAWPVALLWSCMGALAGAATELFSPSEYDTVTVPLVILALLLVLGRV